AYFSIELLRVVRPDLEASHPWSVSMLTPIHLNYSILAFTGALSLFAGVLFGLAPALTASRIVLSETLKEGERGTSQSLRQNRARSLFVMGEMALAVMLLTGAGLMVRSFAISILSRGATSWNYFES